MRVFKIFFYNPKNGTKYKLRSITIIGSMYRQPAFYFSVRNFLQSLSQENIVQLS